MFYGESGEWREGGERKEVIREEQSNGQQDRLPPALELEVMKVLWAEDQEFTVSQVQETMQGYRPLAYTTVLTLLERLYRRGQVTRRRQGRGYAYRPLLARDAAVDLALDRLVRDFFGNSRLSLLNHLQNKVGPPDADESPEDQMDSVLL